MVMYAACTEACRPVDPQIEGRILRNEQPYETKMEHQALQKWCYKIGVQIIDKPHIIILAFGLDLDQTVSPDRCLYLLVD